MVDDNLSKYLFVNVDDIQGNINAFNLNYLPKRIYLRDDCKPLVQNLADFQRVGAITHSFVFGTRGSGKTVVTQYLLKEVPFEKTFYVNCREEDSFHKLIACILRESKSTGLSTSVMTDKFKQMMFDKIVIVLDEIDFLKDLSDVVYFFSRLTKPNVQLVLLGASPNSLSKLDSHAHSSSLPRYIFFPNYEHQELTKILKFRCEEANISNIKEEELDDVINAFAQLTIHEANSDCRVAIQGMKNFFLNRGDLKYCFKMAKDEITMNILHKLTIKQFMLVGATLSFKKTPLLKDLYKAYVKLENKYASAPVTKRRVLDYLRYFQSLELVEINDVRENRANTLSIAPKIEARLWQKVFKIRENELL